MYLIGSSSTRRSSVEISHSGTPINPYRLIIRSQSKCDGVQLQSFLRFILNLCFTWHGHARTYRDTHNFVVGKDVSHGFQSSADLFPTSSEVTSTLSPETLDFFCCSLTFPHKSFSEWSLRGLEKPSERKGEKKRSSHSPTDLRHLISGVISGAQTFLCNAQRSIRKIGEESGRLGAQNEL